MVPDLLILVAGAAVLGLAIYFGTWRLPRMRRIMIAAIVFLIVALFPILVLLFSGDEPAPGTRTVTQEELEEAAR